jgi:hypothetical protein
VDLCAYRLQNLLNETIMKLPLKLAAYSLYLASMLPLIGFTTEITDGEVTHAQIAARPISEEAQENMAEQEIQSSENSIKNHRYKKSPSQTLTPKKEFWFSHNASIPQHWIQAINLTENIIVTEDGSHWKTPNSLISYFWRVQDYVTIQPNSHSKYAYRQYMYQLKNKYSGLLARAELIVGPELSNPHTLWIIGFHPSSQKVHLSNHTSWIVSQADAAIFRDWQANDTIIIGTNNSWFSSYDAILINVEMNNFVRATTY